MSDPRKGPGDVYRYSSVGVQMVMMIGLMAWIGYKLDAHFETSKAYWTAGFAVFGVFAAIIYIVRAMTPPKPPKKSDKNKQ